LEEQDEDEEENKNEDFETLEKQLQRKEFKN
jgi:hypothetical protein